MTDSATHTPDDAWVLVRDMYLNGATGSHVCRRFGFPPSTFRARAAREAADAADPEAARQRVEALRAMVFARVGARDWTLEKQESLFPTPGLQPCAAQPQRSSRM